MAKNDNLGDFLKDVADSIRTKTGTTELINAQDFSDKILNISSGENTLKNLLDATKSAMYLFNNYQGTSADNLIQYSDTENVKYADHMFVNCSQLTTIPQLNTSNVTSMASMFSGCRRIASIPQLDTSKVTDTHYMFSSCAALTTIPQLNTSNVTNMENMFTNCSNLTSIPQLDTSKVTIMYKMFNYCSKLTTIPQLNTSNVTDMRDMFSDCWALTTVPAIDANNVTNSNYLQNIFWNCMNLKSILMTNIGANLRISACKKMEREDLLVVLNNLKTVTSTRTLVVGAENMAKLTDEDKAIAINKGWTLTA